MRRMFSSPVIRTSTAENCPVTPNAARTRPAQWRCCGPRPAPPRRRHRSGWTAQTRAYCALFSGDTLLHTDLAPHNVLVDDRAHIIDWAWPTRGAAWIDPAILILRLLEAGHTLVEADAFAQRFPSWRTAPAEAKEAFAAANAAVWEEIARADSASWEAAMVDRSVASHSHLSALPGKR